MDFSKRKCSGDGLGTKKVSGFYLKIAAQLILNLSVFVVLGWGKRPAILRRTDRQTGRQPKRIRISLARRLNRWVFTSDS